MNDRTITWKPRGLNTAFSLFDTLVSPLLLVGHATEYQKRLEQLGFAGPHEGSARGLRLSLRLDLLKMGLVWLHGMIPVI